MSARNTSVIVPPGKGDAFWILGDRITFKLGPGETGGAFSLAENRSVPGGGPPPHIHAREHELFCVLEGDIEFVLAEAAFRASAGHVQFLPMGVMHGFRNVGPDSLRFLVLATPCGFERFIATAGHPVAVYGENPPPPSPADIQRIQDLIPTFGVEMHPEHRPTRQVQARDHGRRMTVLGIDVVLKLSGAQTAGEFCVAELTIASGSGIPMHAHKREDEVFYVTEGEVEFDVVDRQVIAPAGTTVHLPHGTFHALRNTSTRPARMINVLRPCGLENFLEEASRLGPQASLEQIVAVMQRHGMVLPQ